MFLNINKIGDDPVEIDEALDLTDMKEGHSLLDVRDARLVGTAYKGEGASKDGVDLEARVTATVVLECGRCLCHYDLPISEEFTLHLVAGAQELGSGEFEVTEEDTHLFHAEDGRADTREIAREQVYLSLPLRAVCLPGCKGLCPTCGVNRNRIECGCRSQDLDPRLAPLLDLMKKSGES